jgi:hypothetical protein
MKKAPIFVIVFSLLALTGFAACSTESGKSSQTFNPVTFRGSDSTTTAPFTVTTKEWIVEWTYTPKDNAPGMYYFAIVIWERGKDKFVVWQLPESTYGSTYCYAGAGDYYLEVGAVGIKEWQITIKPPE